MIAGMDEAGRGPPIGPMVIGLVIIEKSGINNLVELGVNDSKLLTAPKREKFKEVIERQAVVAETLTVSAKDIDTKRMAMSLNQIEVEAFRKLLKPHKDKITELQLDAIGHSPDKFAFEFRDMISGRIDARHKGDSIFISVGAASILAKVERDRLVAEIQKKVSKTDPDLPLFGAGYPQQSKSFLEAYVKKYKELPSYARKSWKTCTQILDRYTGKQQDLEDFFM